MCVVLNFLQELNYPDIRARRLAINANLRAFVSDSRGKTTYFDLATLHPMFSLSPTDHTKYWDDGDTSHCFRHAEYNNLFHMQDCISLRPATIALASYCMRTWSSTAVLSRIQIQNLKHRLGSSASLFRRSRA